MTDGHGFGLRPCQGGRQGDFLQPLLAALFEPLPQIGQVAAAIALHELVHFVNNECGDASQERLHNETMARLDQLSTQIEGLRRAIAPG